MATGASHRMTLEELEAKVSESVAAGGTSFEVFGILMNWLKGQIKADSITQDDLLLQRFVNLLQTPIHTDIGPFTLTQVDGIFTRWLERDTVEDQPYKRRYLILQQDVHRLFANGKQYTHALGDSSMSSQYGGRTQSNTSPFCFERENENVRVRGNIDLPRNTDHGNSSYAGRNCLYLTDAEMSGIDQPGEPDASFDAGTSAPLGVGITYPQDDNTGDLTVVRGIFTGNSSSNGTMARTTSRASCQDYKRTEHHYVSESYVCRHCHKQGHLVPSCPTNLDPRYDRTPDRNYQCENCGQWGDHIAALCSRNPHIFSLAQQREHAADGPQSYHTPMSGDGHFHRDLRLRTASPQSRGRSRSPIEHDRYNYRSRSPRRYSPDRGRANTFSPPTQDEDQMRTVSNRDGPSVSPYTLRACKTLELAKNSDSIKEEGLTKPWNGVYDFGSPSGAHLNACSRPTSTKKSRRRRKKLGKVTNSNEGRLKYEDEAEYTVKNNLYPSSSKYNTSGQTGAGSFGGEQVDDSSEAKNKAEDFLSSLAAEIWAEGKKNQGRKEIGPHKSDVEVDDAPIPKFHGRENGLSGSFNPPDIPMESGPAFVQPAVTPGYKLVQCPPFSPEVVSLFGTREIPIINTEVPRKTSDQMMAESRDIYTRIIHLLSLM